MLKQIIGALVILAGVGFIFNSCSQDEPTFEDPCPRDTCDKLGVEEPEVDTTGGGNDTSNPSGKTFDIALELKAKTPGGDPVYDINDPDDNITVTIFDFQNNQVAAGNPEEASLQDCFEENHPKTYFNQQDGHFKKSLYYVDVDTFQLIVGQSGNKDTSQWYKNQGEITVTKDCDTYSNNLIELEKVE